MVKLLQAVLTPAGNLKHLDAFRLKHLLQKYVKNRYSYNDRSASEIFQAQRSQICEEIYWLRRVASISVCDLEHEHSSPRRSRYDNACITLTDRPSTSYDSYATRPI